MKLLASAIIVIFLLCTVNAENEAVFREKGYGNFSVEGAEKIDCFSVEFLREEFPLLEESGSHFIVSVKAEFSPQREGEAIVDLFINDEFILRSERGAFLCGVGGCWARMEVKKELIEGENEIKMCARTGKSITGIVISNDSLMGAYFIPAFTGAGFEKCIFTGNGECVKEYEAPVGEDLNVNILIHNSGSREAFVRFKDKRAIIKDREERKELEDVDFNFLLPAGGTKTISYPVRIKEAGKISLVPSAIYYDNIFGEEKFLLSNTVEVEIFSVKPKVEAFIVEKDSGGRRARAKIVISNESPYSLRDVFLSAVPGEGIAILGQSSLELPVLGAKSSESLEIDLSASELGEFSLGCTASFGSGETVECREAKFLFAEKGTDTLIVGAAVMLVIGALIYIHLQTREEYK